MSDSLHAQFVEMDDYLMVKCSKSASLDEKQTTLDHVVDRIKNKATDKILFDIRESLTNMSDDDHLVCGNLIMERAEVLSNSKVAFLTKSREPVLFLSAAYSQGYSNFVELESLEEASLWFSGRIN